MMSIQRLGSSAQFDPAYIENLIAWKKKYPKSFSEVWLATSYGFPPLEKHRENAEKLAEVASSLREAGIKVSLQLSNSIGHGQYMSSEDCSGLVYDGSPVRKMVGHDGARADYAFCWNGEEFRKYVTEELALYAKAIKPSYLWIDDDFRADNHNPVTYGCFCGDCMRRFNEKVGCDFTREELLEEILHGDLEIRKAYVRFMRDGLSDLMEAMCRSVHEVSPGTTFALQNSYHNYTGGEWVCLFDKMKEVSGRAPGFRSGGGAYDDHDPNGLFDKAHTLSMQNSVLPAYVTERIPEIENLPFTFSGKSPAGTALESALHLANGHTGLSYSMMMSYAEEPSFYERFLKLFDQMGDYFERLSEVSSCSRGGGLEYVLATHDYLKTLKPGETLNDLNAVSIKGAAALLRDGVPMTFDRNAENTLLLSGGVVHALSDEDIETVLSRHVLMDGETVSELLKRGYDLGLSPRAIGADDVLKLYERYTDDELNKGGYLDQFKSNFFVSRSLVPYSFDALPEGARVLGTYGMTPTPKDGCPYGASTVIFRTKEGGTVAACGYSLFTCIVPSTQRDRLLRIADAIGSHPLPARILSPDQAFLYPRVEKDGHKTLSVSAANGTVGEEELMIAIRDPASEDFHWMSQYGEAKRLAFEKKDGEYILTLPKLAAYSVGTVFCD